MKKLSVLILMTLTISSYASTYLTCGLYEGETAVGKPFKKVSMDLDDTSDGSSFVYTMTSNIQSFNIMRGTHNFNRIFVGFSEKSGYVKSSLSESMIRNMPKGESISVHSYSQDEEGKTYMAICYMTGKTQNAPFDI